MAIIAYLNAWGILKTGITDLSNRYQDISFLRSMLKEQVFAGQSLPGFTECYWSTPETALHEIRSEGLEVDCYIGAEGFAGGMGMLLAQLSEESLEAYENVVQIAAETSELVQYRDATDHLHILVRKSTDSKA